MTGQSLLRRPGLGEGDDVIVTFPSGREVAGRILCWIGGRADVAVETTSMWTYGFREVHNYPKSWIRAWEE